MKTARCGQILDTFLGNCFWADWVGGEAEKGGTKGVTYIFGLNPWGAPGMIGQVLQKR